VFSWKNLEVLDASNNLSDDTIPQEIADLPQLTSLWLANNQLSGKIPTGVSSWKNLEVLDVSNNLLNGTISQEITALPYLTTLLLYQNRLSGSLPSNILSWKLLTTLNLCRNAISGQIPEEFGLLVGLTELDLSENQLSGQIPVQLGRLSGIFLNLSSNHLTGRIPIGFDNDVYAGSFLNNPGLCAYSSSVNIDKCNSKSSKISIRILVLIICSVIAKLLLALFFVISIFMRRKQGLDLTWELTSFHRLNFTGSDIMSGMTQNNVIGRGGSGIVYRVAVNPSRDIVVVKRIWNSGMLEQKLEKQFLAEVKTLSSIRHSKIVKLLCFIYSEDSKLLVYEYLENGSLDLWLHRKSGASTFSDSVQQGNLDWPKRLQIAVGVAHGLSYMHHDCSQPIVHRDVKSSNIRLDSEFNAKIADFGLAKMLIKQRESATTSAVAGSFGYIAPGV
jgi:tRNA A-37 threonylcarbamoyl transferase component Bud32